MTQLTQHPFKEVIRKAGALHFWEADLATNQMVDLVGGADLIRSPGADTGDYYMVAKPAGDDQSAGPWIGPTLDFSGGHWSGPDQRYLSIPSSAGNLTGAFTLFARIRPMGNAGYLRDLLRIKVPGVTWDFNISLEHVYEPAEGGIVFRSAIRTTAGSLHKSHPFGEPYGFGETPDGPTLYLAWSRSEDNVIRARVIVPGEEMIERVEGVPRPGVVFAPGFFRASVTSTSTGGWASFSNAFILPREASDDELYRWAKLLETGRQGDGRCLPLNNSEGTLSAPLGLTDTILDLDSVSSFPNPGPTEEGRVTLIDPLNPTQSEVCALLVNDGNQLEVRRGQEGTQAREWPAGTVVKGLLTNWLVEPRVDWIPPYTGGAYLSDQGSYLALRDKPFIPKVASDVGAVSQTQFDTVRAQLKDGQDDNAARIAELERGPTWASIRGKPQVATQDDLNEMAQIMNAMMLRIIALESGGGGSDPDTSHYLTDASGAHLTDASGAILTGPVTIEGALLDQYGAQLTDASGNILMGPPIAGKTLTDSTGQTLTDGAMAPLLSA